MQSQRTFTPIHFWNVIFTLMILFFHFDINFNIWKFLGLSGQFGWYISIDFFFLVSGVYIYQKATSPDSLSAPKFLYECVQKIWPPYIISFILTFAANVFFRNDVDGFISTYEYLIDNFLEIFILHGIGLGRGSDYVNPTTWIISIFLICSLFIYYLLTKHQKTFENIIAPISIIICYSWLYRSKGCLDVTITSVEGFYCNSALMRGFADICLGVYAAKLSTFIQYRINNNLLAYGKKSVLAVKLSGVFAFFYVIIASIQYGCSRSDFVYILFLAYGVAMSFIPCETFGICKAGEYTNTAKILLYFSRLSLYQYLLHQMYRDWIFPITFPSRSEFTLGIRIIILLIYLIIVTLSAMLLNRKTK